MFRATVSPIFRSTLTVYTAFWSNVMTLLSAANRWQIGSNCVTCRQQTARSVHYSKKKPYVQSESCWRWTKLSSETCRTSLKESIKEILLHLVGCWCRCTNEAQSRKRQVHCLSMNSIVTDGPYCVETALDLYISRWKHRLTGISDKSDVWLTAHRNSVWIRKTN